MRKNSRSLWKSQRRSLSPKDLQGRSWFCDFPMLPRAQTRWIWRWQGQSLDLLGKGKRRLWMGIRSNRLDRLYRPHLLAPRFGHHPLQEVRRRSGRHRNLVVIDWTSSKSTTNCQVERSVVVQTFSVHRPRLSGPKSIVTQMPMGESWIP